MNLLRKQLLTGLVGVCALAFAACQSADTPPTYLLGPHKSARIGSGLVVTVDSIQDSRCPREVMCITGGAARVDLSIAQGIDTLKRQLYTGPDSKRLGSDSVTVKLSNSTYRIVLDDVVPYPNAPGEAVNQQAVLQISRL